MPGRVQTPLLSRPGPSFRYAEMLIGHVNLAASIEESGERFVSLVEALRESGVRQHVLVRNSTLAARLAAVEDVDVGPIVRSPVMANCLMPRVDIVHVHEPAAGQVGLLLALTRSIPYVLTHRGTVTPRGGPLVQAIYRRASMVICQDDSELAILRHWLPGITAEIVPDIEHHDSAASHLRLYQNSQRMPIAGNSGIQ